MTTQVTPNGLLRLYLGPLVMALFGCTDNQNPESAKQLWAAIHAESYHDWQHAPGYETRRHSNAPHGDEVTIYVNDALAARLAAQAPLDTWPVGSTIVKDGFDGNKLDLVAVMDKRADGWFWAEYSSDGDASYSGHPDLCIDCHRSGADFVRAFGFPASNALTRDAP